MSTPERQTIGVLGGSFDPPHAAHVLLGAYALSAGPIDRLIVVPTFAHPFGKALASFEHRVAMCELAFEVLQRTEVSRIEATLETPSFTARTLEALAHQCPGAQLRLIVGADVLRDLPRWRDVDRIAEIAPLFAVGRDGIDATGAGIEIAALALPAISSTRIREALRAGESVEYLVPRAIEAYCRVHGLYR